MYIFGGPKKNYELVQNSNVRKSELKLKKKKIKCNEKNTLICYDVQNDLFYPV